MRAVRRAVAVTGLMLSVAGGAVFAQQARKALSNPAPQYPELAERLHLKGSVKVTLVIGADGHIKDTQFQGGNPVLVDAVAKALKEWKYAPANSESTMSLEFKF
ncbi:MAG TPA: energy transducer TonB [Candidatus Angelobacter sp.]|nr:energy transducer TonB [Candidatus Angelobacter sp.]